jgi:hypothetical protein
MGTAVCERQWLFNQRIDVFCPAARLNAKGSFGRSTRIDSLEDAARRTANRLDAGLNRLITVPFVSIGLVFPVSAVFATPVAAGSPREIGDTHFQASDSVFSAVYHLWGGWI